MSSVNCQYSTARSLTGAVVDQSKRAAGGRGGMASGEHARMLWVWA